jgi:hypothetical protein
MKFVKRVFLLLMACIIYSSSYSQNDSCNLQITLLTCGPGADLYSVFGHSGIRVKNQNDHSDLIYNYGTFDFEDPDFYIKFVKGKLLYSLSVQSLNDFLYEYRIEKRSVIEQQLTLGCDEKHKLDDALRNNAREENRYYLYQFFFDNCSTRLRDIVSNNLHDTLTFKEIRPQPVPTFRTMIHYYLDKGEQYWSKAGIDLLLGSLIDRQPTNKEVMFLPDYLMKGFDSAAEKGNPIVSSKKIIVPPANPADLSVPNALHKETFGSQANPLTVMWLLMLTGTIFTFIKSDAARRFMKIFDIALFFILGGFGCLILFMWFGTEHDLCSQNYNLLWALPTHLIISFFLFTNRKWVRRYFTITSVLYLLILLLWAFLPQGMNPAFLPLVLVATIRSFQRSSLKRAV